MIKGLKNNTRLGSMFWNIIQRLAQFLKIKIKSDGVVVSTHDLWFNNIGFIQLSYHTILLTLDKHYI
jgi:hypothetical protein